MQPGFIRSIGVVIVSLATALSAAAADAPREWPQHLGPARNGISAETGLIDAKPAEAPKEVWRVPGGIGMSGIAISRGVALTLVNQGSRQKLLALDASTGATKWATELAPPYRNQMGDGPRATPTIAGDRVFAHTGEGILAAVNVADGKKLWSVNVPKELKGEPNEYGVACSPLVIGDQVIVAANSPDASVAAFDVATGKLAWKAGEDPSGYSSAALLNLGGVDQIIIPTGNSVLGLAPGKGTVLWRYPWETNFSCNTATPVAYKGQVLISSGENHGSVLLAVKPAGEKMEVTKVWDSLGPRSVLRSEWQTPLILGDHLYGFDNVGGAGPVSHLTCLEAATGQKAWQQARFGKGNFIAADGKLFIITFEGELVIARASPKPYEEVYRGPLLAKTRQAPSLCDGRLYARDDQDIVCIDVRKAAKP